MNWQIDFKRESHFLYTIHWCRFRYNYFYKNYLFSTSMRVTVDYVIKIQPFIEVYIFWSNRLLSVWPDGETWVDIVIVQSLSESIYIDCHLSESIWSPRPLAMLLTFLSEILISDFLSMSRHRTGMRQEWSTLFSYCLSTSFLVVSFSEMLYLQPSCFVEYTIYVFFRMYRYS